MGETKPWAIGIVIVCTLFTSFGSFFMKKGVDKLALSLQGFLDAYLIIVGLFFYFVGFILLTLAFRHGDLSVLFPFVSLGFIWVALLSYFFLGESIGFLKIVGIISIVAGVSLLGLAGLDKGKFPKTARV
jgi:multidrug transporter EmrE-like cation transporter